LAWPAISSRHRPAAAAPRDIRLFADQNLAPLADAMADDPDQRLWLLNHASHWPQADQLETVARILKDAR
jgi:hypothetical protein